MQTASKGDDPNINFKGFNDMLFDLCKDTLQHKDHETLDLLGFLLH